MLRDLADEESPSDGRRQWLRQQLDATAADLLHGARLAHINAGGVEPEYGLELLLNTYDALRRSLLSLAVSARKAPR